MKNLYFISFGFFAFANATFAQTDTLIWKVTHAKEPEEKLYAAFEVVKNYMGTAPDTAIKYLQIALKDSTKAKDKKPVGLCLKGLSAAYYYLGDYEKMETYAKKAINIFKHLGDNENLLSARKNYALSLDMQGKHNEALIIYFEILDQSKQAGNIALIAGTLNDIGNIYTKTGNYKQALHHQREGLAYLENNLDAEQIKGNILNSIGYIFHDLKQNDSAVYYYEQALIIKKKTANAYRILNTQNNLCACIDYQTETKKSIKCFEELLVIQKEINDKVGVVRTLINLATGHSFLKEYTKSLTLLDSAVKLLEETGNIDLQTEAYKKYSMILFEKGDYKQAYLMRKEYEFLNDSLTNIAKQQSILELYKKYETQQKEEEIKLLNAQKENDGLIIQKQRWTLISTALFIAIISILTFMLFTNYQKKQRLRKEQELQNQKEAERIRIARDMHDDIGTGLTRIVMRSEQLKLHLQSGKKLKNGIVESLEKMAAESRLLSHNIGEIIWSLNPKNDALDHLFAYIRNYAYDYLEEADITCNIEFPDNIPNAPVSPELRRNIFLIVKESLNNVVKHASATEVEIVLLLSEKYFSITIKDNGKGMNKDNIPSNRNGLTNIEKRTKEIGGNFSIESKPNSGTVVKVEQVKVISEKTPTKV